MTDPESDETPEHENDHLDRSPAELAQERQEEMEETGEENPV